MKRAGEGIGKEEWEINALIFHLPYSTFLIPVMHCGMENRYET